MCTKYLIGATGFIGSFLLKNLSTKNHFVVITRSNSRKFNSFKNIKIIKNKNFNELNSKLKKVKIDIVIHCATHYVKKHNFDDIEKLTKSNILFGNVILENIKQMRVKKFINFSTVWTNYNGQIENPYNLYASYKSAFSDILKFYEKINSKTKFYEVFLSDTFGYGDRRDKLLNVIKKNYKKKLITKIVSKKLYINLLNVEDVASAINLIIKKKVISGKYVLKNKKNFKISEIIKKLNKISNNKTKVKWLSNKSIKPKNLNHKKLNNWIIKKSNINDIINFIKSN